MRSLWSPNVGGSPSSLAVFSIVISCCQKGTKRPTHPSAPLAKVLQTAGADLDLAHALDGGNVDGVKVLVDGREPEDEAAAGDKEVAGKHDEVDGEVHELVGFGRREVVQTLVRVRPVRHLEGLVAEDVTLAPGRLAYPLGTRAHTVRRVSHDGVNEPAATPRPVGDVKVDAVEEAVAVAVLLGRAVDAWNDVLALLCLSVTNDVHTHVCP